MIEKLVDFPRRLPGYLVGKSKRELREILKNEIPEEVLDEFRELLVEKVWGEENRGTIRMILRREIDSFLLRVNGEKEPLRHEEGPKREMISFGVQEVWK